MAQVNMVPVDLYLYRLHHQMILLVYFLFTLVIQYPEMRVQLNLSPVQIYLDQVVVLMYLLVKVPLEVLSVFLLVRVMRVMVVIL